MSDDSKSGLHLYSVGIVAKDKPLDTYEIDVIPIETNHMFNDEVDKTEKEEKVTSANSAGTKIPITSKTSQTIKATWMALGSGGNRVSAPDVRKGESVNLWRYKDTEEYFWEKHYTETELRRLERVLHMYGGHSNVGVRNDAENSYWTLISTIDKLLQLHTSRADGEPFGWDFKLDTKRGVFSVTDNSGITCTFNAEERTTTLEVEDKVITLTKEFLVKATTQTYFDTPETTMTGNQTVNGNSKVDGNERIDGNLSVGGALSVGAGMRSSGRSHEVYGDFRLIGNLYIDGECRVSGNHSIGGNLSVGGSFPCYG